MIDLYKVLDVDHLATENQIKKRFRFLAKLYHPDKHNGSREFEARFKEVLNAYEILSDKSKRYQYDLHYNKENNESIHDSNKYNYQNTSYNKNQRKWVIKESYKKFGYYFVIILVIILFWLITKYSNNSSTTGNSKVDKELEQIPSDRPETGDIDFSEE